MLCVEFDLIIGKIWIACAKWPACVRRRSIKNVKTFLLNDRVFLVVLKPDIFANLNIEMLNFIQMLAKMNSMTTFESFGGVRLVCAWRGWRS